MQHFYNTECNFITWDNSTFCFMIKQDSDIPSAKEICCFRYEIIWYINITNEHNTSCMKIKLYVLRISTAGIQFTYSHLLGKF